MTKEYLIPENFLKEIETFLTKDKKSVSSSRLKKYISDEFIHWLEERGIPFKFLSYIHKNKLTKITIPTCPVCGKELSFQQIIWGTKFCSYTCSSKSEEVQEKYKQTCKERYGVEHSFQSEQIKEKIKTTNIKRYGVERPPKLKYVKEKIKQTSLNKYGVEYPSQSEEIKEKYKQTCLDRYGIKNPALLKETQEKAKQTCLEKYNVEYTSQAKEWKKERRSNHWNLFSSLLFEKHLIPLFSKKEYINDTGRTFKCLSCNKNFTSEGSCDYRREHTNKDGTYTTLQVHNIYCPHCFKARYSKKEKEVLEFVKTIYKGEILENHKGLFPNKNMELDIYLPQLNLGIEFDGDYWHSKEGAKEKDETKNQLCEEKGIKLLRIKESEWDISRQFVEEKIKEFVRG